LHFLDQFKKSGGGLMINTIGLMECYFSKERGECERVVPASLLSST